jgi:hypothetical protein
MRRIVAVAAAALTGIVSPAAQRSPSSPVADLLAGHIPTATSHGSTRARYRFVTEYTTVGPQGGETGTHVIAAEFTAHDKTVQWTTVTVGQTPGHGQPAAAAAHRAYLEGFQYARDVSRITSSDFFAAFPPDANDERNLIWDELMFQSFVADLDRLKLNEPVVANSGDVNLAGSGAFNNRRIELTLLGAGRRHGEDCVLVRYEAPLNRFTINASGGVTVSGGSDYSGEVWISVQTRQIEYGTLVEDVAGVVGNIPGAAGPQPLHVLRTAAALERIGL